MGATTPRHAALADDGVREVLLMHARPSRRFAPEQPVTFGVHTTDTDHEWHLHVEGPAREVRPGPAGPDSRNAVATGSADELHLFLWNRAAGPTLSGDVDLWDTWRDTARIR